MMIYKSGGMTQRLEQLFHIRILVDIASSLQLALKATSFTTESKSQMLSLKNNGITTL